MSKGEFFTGPRNIVEFDQAHAGAMDALRKEKLGFFLVLRDNLEADDEGSISEGKIAFYSRGHSQRELEEFLIMVIASAREELKGLRAALEED